MPGQGIGQRTWKTKVGQMNGFLGQKLEHAWKVSLDEWQRVIPLKMTEIPLFSMRPRTSPKTSQTCPGGHKVGQMIDEARPKDGRMHRSYPRHMATSYARKNDQNTPIWMTTRGSTRVFGMHFGQPWKLFLGVLANL